MLNIIQKGDLETLKVLLKTKEEKNPIIISDNSLGELTVLHIAASFGHLNITIWYQNDLGFSDINPKDNKGNTPLSQAIGQRQIDVVKYYIKNGYQASSKILLQSINSHLCLATMQPHEYSHKVISLKFLILQINLELKKKV